MEKALVIQPDGTLEVRPFESGNLASLKALIDGGYLEYIPNGDDVAIVNEDGLRLRLPLNPKATAILDQLGYEWNGVLLGPVALASTQIQEITYPDGYKETDRVTISVADEVIDQFMPTNAM
ncbi:hypothetical protein [Aeromicrobium sp. 179-A 4D2 NHS]|uniref:DUF3846 domain-containing protein n=1 Tax=Aeromicrobium sp. 179-A 4D2 NHS TaxID=3142375 RepID=UPI0039A11E6D